MLGDAVGKAGAECLQDLSEVDSGCHDRVPFREGKVVRIGPRDGIFNFMM